ncbi:MAG: TIGR03960 family B12-binding radical SAM protein [Oscillospiraceae bacterium]|nr:TIGR03960 family B12-binding radical SAM protein [Oscillospiraceae bacterium]
MIKKDYEKILRKVQKPARYTGGEYNEVIKDKSKIDVRFAFAFPDMYEIGMSNLGVKILYGVLNSLDYVWCERTFTPADDMTEQLRRNNLDLYALESGDSLKDFDFIGFTLQYELSYTNILHMLDLSGIPAPASERGEDSPVIIGGGPCAYNPEPLAEIFDLFVIGEGEEVICEVVELYREYKLKGVFCSPGGKAKFLADCSNKIEGVYAPGMPGAGTKKINKRIVKNFDGAYAPVNPVVPSIEAIHDRITLEVFRGCIRGCRFCQAGFIYRPVRERSPGKLNQIALETYENTGYSEISLASLSVSDYSKLAELTNKLTCWTDEANVNLSLPSMRIDAFSQDLLDKTSRVRQTALTFAPEAGSQRMRDIINKNLSDEEIEEAVKTAFNSGRSGVKLYFMLGLPGETDEDIKEIARLAKKIAGLYYKRENKQKNKGLTITISAASFVPKAHTPFCFEGQNSYEELIRKQKLLKDEINSNKIKYNYHDAKISKLEAAFSRGDRKLSKVLLEAYRLGARFDGWDEFFKFEIWEKAFENCGLTMEEYCERKYNYDEILPWEFIDAGVSKEFLISENKKSKLGITTDNCRESCSGCGVSKNKGGDYCL